MEYATNRPHLPIMPRVVVTLRTARVLMLVAAIAPSVPGHAQPPSAPGRTVPPATAIEVAVRELARTRAAREDMLTRAVARFYGDVGFTWVWTDAHGFTRAGQQLRQAIATAADEGLDARDYPLPRLDTLSAAARAHADVQLSLLAMRFARDLGWGMTTPGSVHRDHAYPRRPFHGDSLLHAWVDAPDPGAALRAVAPVTPAYARLRTALQQLRAVAAAGGWQRMSSGAPLRTGSVGPRVQELRTRLVERGDLAPAFAIGDTFDLALEGAVARFQERHGLTADAVVGPATRTALNVRIADRIRQVELGMERVRWLPPIEQGRWIAVNLADQQAYVLDDGHPVFTTRVVIGTTNHQTPMFVDTLTNIVLNPAWNVPPSIAAKEILPKLRRDPQYLVRNHMVRIGGDIQQQPGPWNALGQLAFMFPNRFNVYMHDTPAKALFAEVERAYSHGCIRLQRPRDLAILLLEDEGWSPARLDSAIATGTRHVVWLRRGIPVRITYATAFADDDGSLQFRRDVYGRDALLERALARARQTTR